MKGWGAQGAILLPAAGAAGTAGAAGPAQVIPCPVPFASLVFLAGVPTGEEAGGCPVCPAAQAPTSMASQSKSKKQRNPKTTSPEKSAGALQRPKGGAAGPSQQCVPKKVMNQTKAS